MKKIIRTATIGLSLYVFGRGILSEMKAEGYEVVALSSPDDELKKVEECEGVRTIGVRMERHISLLKDVKSLFQLYKVFKTEKPDMVHSMTPKAGLLSMIAARMAGIPVRVHTFTGLVWPTADGVKRKILMMTDKITCACATHVIPEGEGVKADLAAHITKKPLKVLGYGNVRGIDLSYYKRKGDENENQNENCHADTSKTDNQSTLTFLFVGRIARDKGVNELIMAFDRLKTEYEKSLNIKLTIVGWDEHLIDPILPETRKIMEECDSIVIAGPQSDVRPFYEQSDVFVFPSYREGFPNVVIEAGAMDLPCIVTDINGSREIIVNENENKNENNHSESGRDNSIIHSEKMKVCDNGVIIPSQDENALYEAMKWMVEHPEQRERMAKNARPMIASRFEQSFVRKCLLDFYKEILTDK